jgi:hypothetical protein
MSKPDLVIEAMPEGPWLGRLRVGHWVWLVKETRSAQVAFPWQPPEPGTIAGRIGIQIAPGHIQAWYVGENGRGFDDKPLLCPIEGNFPENPPPLPEPQLQQILRALARLVDHHNQLETRVSLLETKMNHIIVP